MARTQFTSESVSEGHPDKVCDQVSDAILDAILTEDPTARVACETMVKTGFVVIAGEITTTARIEFPDVIRAVVKDIGYTSSDMGFDGSTCAIFTAVERQSPDIAQGVNEGEGEHHEQGAGDQGMMFGFAVDETPELMPAPLHYSHVLTRKLAEARKTGLVDWLRPDAKSQVTIDYENNVPVRINTVVVSTQHSPSVTQSTIKEFVREEIIKKHLPANLLDGDTRYFINPTGRFVIGGPMGDSGLTGRKIIVDTYGGMGRHGGGAFSGKDPSKVNRSACYYARYIAKHLVAAGLARRCEVQLAYAIGVAQPVSILVQTFGTGRLSDDKLSKLVREHFDCRPGALIEELDLLKPIYRATAAYGHFGREEGEFSWERTPKLAALTAELPKVSTKAHKRATSANMVANKIVRS